MWLARGLTLTAAALGAPADVQASCVGPKLKLLWTYPEAGAEDVPTNAVFWATSSVWGAQPTASLNGALLDVQGTAATSSVRITPVLMPNTAYTLVIDYSTSPVVQVQRDQNTRFEIAFETGSGPVPDIAAPTVSRVLRTPAAIDAQACPDIINAQGCFDTGQDTLFTFEVEGNAAIGWMIDGPGATVWPAKCGDPGLYLSGQPSYSACYNIRSIGPGGRFSEPTDYCTQSAAADSGVSDSGIDRTARTALAESAGCAAVSGARTAARAFWAIVALCLLLASRRRFSTRRVASPKSWGSRSQLRRGPSARGRGLGTRD